MQKFIPNAQKKINKLYREKFDDYFLVQLPSKRWAAVDGYRLEGRQGMVSKDAEQFASNFYQEDLSCFRVEYPIRDSKMEAMKDIVAIFEKIEVDFASEGPRLRELIASLINQTKSKLAAMLDDGVSRYEHA